MMIKDRVRVIDVNSLAIWMQSFTLQHTPRRGCFVGAGLD